MKRLAIIALSLGIIATALLAPIKSIEQVNSTINQPAATSTPLLIARPERQRQRLVVSAGLSETQQTQYQAALVTFGKQRKHLLQQRKSVSRLVYKAQLEQIKADHQHQLASIMGPQQYQLFSNKMADKRLARVERRSRHVQAHKYEGRLARRTRNTVMK
ncbi:MAG: hypothetical protein HRT35_17110 [Algicola sp.]|nr:hypothetical protein [Algicola sp.]